MVPAAAGQLTASLSSAVVLPRIHSSAAESLSLAVAVGSEGFSAGGGDRPSGLASRELPGLSPDPCCLILNVGKYHLAVRRWGLAGTDPGCHFGRAYGPLGPLSGDVYPL